MPDEAWWTLEERHLIEVQRVERHEPNFGPFQYVNNTTTALASSLTILFVPSGTREIFKAGTPSHEARGTDTLRCTPATVLLWQEGGLAESLAWYKRL